MAPENPVAARLIRGIDQRRMGRITITAETIGVIVNTLSLLAMGLTFISPALAALVVVPIFLLSILASLALPVLVAVLAVGITHPEIAGENGQLLWVTPLESTAIADGFLAGVSRCLAWAQHFGLVFAITLGLGAGFLAVAYLMTSGDAGFGPPGSGPSPLGVMLGFLIVVILAGGPVAGVSWTTNHALINVAIRVGVTVGFRLRHMDSASIRGIAGAVMGGMIMIVALGCSAVVWLPRALRFSSSDFAIGIIGGTVIGVVLLLFVTTGVYGWMKELLVRSIERARSQ